MSEAVDHTDAPRFEWRYRDDAGWMWGFAHTTAGLCPGCSENHAIKCPRCGGRLHREPIAKDDLSHTYYCQQERTDNDGGRPRTRTYPSIAARKAAMRREAAARRERQRDRMELLHGIRVGWWVLCVVALGIALVYTAFTEEPPPHHERTMVCKDGTSQPPGINREGCKDRGGLERWEW